MARDRFQKQSLGASYVRIKESRVLLVGAGGIGCELLKNLVLTGYGEIHIIDLDTIDLSNLNRQFLFRHEHIKKAKASVAMEAAQKFNPGVKLVSHFANIKDAQFDVEWFSSFDIVFNALDNLDARRHVNRMCLAADVPLIESGTTGFNGQIQVIKRGKTACYDCSPKTVPKTFAVCTIRSTPSQPIHCIVWAKSYLLPELFGVSEDETQDIDADEDAENVEEIKKLKEEAEALKKIRQSIGSEDFVQKVFDKVFKEDVERLAKMEDMWKTRKRPEPLSYDKILKQASDVDDKIASTDQRAWTIAENLVVFKDALIRLTKRVQTDSEESNTSGSPKRIITFDKDDEDTLDFVTTAANLRAIIFGIEPKSKFDTKQMAGNIIPAIATTNAMVGALCVMQAFKVLKGEYGRTKMIFVDRGNVSASPVDLPNPDCAVCSVALARVRVREDTTLHDVVDEILKKELGYSDEISVLNQAGGIVFDPDMEDNLEKKLTEVGIVDNSIIIVKDDEDENPKVDLHLIVECRKAGVGTEESESNVPAAQLVKKNEEEELEIPLRTKQPKSLPGMDVMEASQITNSTTSSMTTKRKRDLDDVDGENSATFKKLNITKTNDGKETIILDEEEGAIEIED